MNASNCIHFFSRFFLALTLSACDLGDNGDDLPGDSSETGASTNVEGASFELDEAPEVIVAGGDGSINATGACPYRYQCGVSGSWYSTSAGCTASCTSNCTPHEYNNGHCIPR